MVQDNCLEPTDFGRLEREAGAAKPCTDARFRFLTYLISLLKCRSSSLAQTCVFCLGQVLHVLVPEQGSMRRWLCFVA